MDDIGFVVVRLTETENSDDIHKLASLYALPEVVCLAVISQTEEKATKIWTEHFPSPTEFLALFPSPVHPPDPVTQITVRTSARTCLRDFPASAKLAEVKQWIRSEFGDTVIIHLPSSEDLTLSEAGLASSVVLEASFPLADDDALPRLHRERARPDAFLDLIFASVKFVMSILNPWDAGEDLEPFWEYAPSPERRRMQTLFV
jgi:hypothetical protein